MDAFTRSILIGLQAGSRYRLLRGSFWIIVGPRGPIASTLRPTQDDAIAALGGVRWPRRGHVVLPVSLAADEPRPAASRRARA